jgi:hypothetical protein
MNQSNLKLLNTEVCAYLIDRGARTDNFYIASLGRWNGRLVVADRTGTISVEPCSFWDDNGTNRTHILNLGLLSKTNANKRYPRPAAIIADQITHHSVFGKLSGADYWVQFSADNLIMAYNLSSSLQNINLPADIRTLARSIDGLYLQFGRFKGMGTCWTRCHELYNLKADIQAWANKTGHPQREVYKWLCHALVRSGPCIDRNRNVVDVRNRKPVKKKNK